MGRPYNKRTVDEAAQILDLYASNFATLAECAAAIGVRMSSTSFRLAEKAYAAVPNAVACYRAAEAATLVRSGWMIGDPIDLTAPATFECVPDETPPPSDHPDDAPTEPSPLGYPGDYGSDS